MAGRLKNWITCVGLGLAVLGWTVPVLAADEHRPSADTDVERITALVKRLGSDEFSSRESATEQLTKIGLPAFKPLEEAVESPDREVRYRAARILGIIR